MRDIGQRIEIGLAEQSLAGPATRRAVHVEDLLSKAGLN